MANTLYDWANLILGTGSDITKAIFQTKEQESIADQQQAIATQQTAITKQEQNEAYMDFVKKLAIGIGGVFAVILGFKLVKKL